MTRTADKPDSTVRRKAARRTAWIVGIVALVIYVGAILEVVLKR